MLEGGADERFPSTKHIYMPSILSLNLAIVQFLIIVYPYPAYDARIVDAHRSGFALLRSIRVTWCTVLGGTESK